MAWPWSRLSSGRLVGCPAVHHEPADAVLARQLRPALQTRVVLWKVGALNRLPDHLGDLSLERETRELLRGPAPRVFVARAGGRLVRTTGVAAREQCRQRESGNGRSLPHPATSGAARPEETGSS